MFDLLQNPLILGAAAVGCAIGAGGAFWLTGAVAWAVVGGIAGAVLVPVALFYAIMSNFRM